MKKVILLLIIISSFAIAQTTNTIHIEVLHETCGGPNQVLYTGDFEEGDTFTFAGANLPLDLQAWQNQYDLFSGAELNFPTGSLENHIEVLATIGHLDCDNPGFYADPTGSGFQIFMFIDITVYLNDQPIHMTFPSGSEPSLTFQNSQLLALLGSMGVNIGDISFGYLDGGSFSMNGITINVGFTSTRLTLSHFSQFAGGVGNIFTDVDEEDIIPTEYNLSQNYPNPFNPTTQISYSLPETGDVTLTVHDILGRNIATLVSGEVSAGNHVVTFDAEGLSSGLYIYKLKTKNNLFIKKMLLMK